MRWPNKKVIRSSPLGSIDKPNKAAKTEWSPFVAPLRLQAAAGVKTVASVVRMSGQGHSRRFRLIGCRRGVARRQRSGNSPFRQGADRIPQRTNGSPLWEACGRVADSRAKYRPGPRTRIGPMLAGLGSFSVARAMTLSFPSTSSTIRPRTAEPALSAPHTMATDSPGWTLKAK